MDVAVQFRKMELEIDELRRENESLRAYIARLTQPKLPLGPTQEVRRRTEWTDRSALNYDCMVRGSCYNRRRPKLRALDAALPGNNRFGDLDAWAELNRQFMYLEFKDPGAPILDGQRIALQNRSIGPENTVMVVVGDGASMIVDEIRMVTPYGIGEPISSSLDDLLSRINDWSNISLRKPRR